MKVSFLIPSKNRLSLLKHAVASIIDQDGMDVEIVITDNDSADDYGSYVNGLKDSRIVYYRQPAPVSVTDNWKQALSLATGDYILMLGDDDALAPGFLAGMRQYLTESGPDVVYIAAYHYCYPGVIAEKPTGYLASVLNSEFLAGKQRPFNLDLKYAHELADSVLGFHYRFGLNAQHFVLKTSFVRRFSTMGGIYQSPYPDTFAAVVVFTHASSILVIPDELVMIGISPKSFGAYYFSDRHDEGYKFLDNAQVEPKVRAALQDVVLPGDRNNTNWLFAAESARQAFPAILTRPVDFERYRTLQMISVLRDGYVHQRPDVVAELRAKLSETELPLFDALEAVVRATAENQPQMLAQTFDTIVAQLRQYEPATLTDMDIGAHASIWDAYKWLKSHQSGREGRTVVTATAASSALSSGTRRPAANDRSWNDKSRSARKSGTSIRKLARSALMMFPAARQHFERAANDARRVEQLQAENMTLRRQLAKTGGARPVKET